MKKIEIQEKKHDNSSAVKRIMIAAILMETALDDLDKHQDLKYRASVALKACVAIKSFLQNHRDAGPVHRELFHRMFEKPQSHINKLSTVLEGGWDLKESELESLAGKIKDLLTPIDQEIEQELTQ